MTERTRPLAQPPVPQSAATWQIPARFRPFVRLVVVAVLVMVADFATSHLVRQGATFDFPAVTVVRLVASLLILRYPLAGFVVSLEVDKWDWFWLGMADRSAADQDLYQSWDKSVDLICLAIALIVVLQWPDRRARWLALGTFAWRTAGVVAAIMLGHRWLLIVFPNVFESIYLTYMIFRVLSGHQQMLHSVKATALVGLALLIPKVSAEVFLHAFNDRPWHMFSVLPGGFSFLDAWLWGLALYALPLVVLVISMQHAEGRATRGDPEAQVSAV